MNARSVFARNGRCVLIAILLMAYRPMKGEEPTDRPTTLRLTGVWQANLILPNGTKRLAAQVRLVQDGNLVTFIEAAPGNPWAGVATFEGRINGTVIEGHMRDPRSTPQNPVWGNPLKIILDDPDHFHAGNNRGAPMFRAAPSAYDLPCDSDNTWHTDSWYAFTRGRKAAADLKDFSTAACWFRIAANQGEPRAQGMLAYLLYEGKGTDRDYPQAFSWAQKSAERKDMLGEMVLVTLYKEGKGVPADPQKAAYWDREVANQKASQMWARMNQPTALGVTPLQAIGLAFSIFAGDDNSSANQNPMVQCANGARSFSCSADKKGRFS